MKDHRITALTCPACSASLDGALNVAAERPPCDGDVTFCFACRAMLVFCGTPVNSLRYPTGAEQDLFLADPVVQQVIAALRLTKEQ